MPHQAQRHTQRRSPDPFHSNITRHPQRPPFHRLPTVICVRACVYNVSEGRSGVDFVCGALTRMFSANIHARTQHICISRSDNRAKHAVFTRDETERERGNAVRAQYLVRHPRRATTAHLLRTIYISTENARPHQSYPS